MVNKRKMLICIAVAIIFSSCKSVSHISCGWTKVFSNNAEGATTFGNKQELVKAVRAGYSVRVGFGEKPVEHISTVNFLSIVDGKIFKGEVFAQIPTILGQLPAVENDSLKMRLRTWNHWTKLVGTNGYTTAIMTNYQNDTLVSGNNDRYQASTWYVEYPCHGPRYLDKKKNSTGS